MIIGVDIREWQPGVQTGIGRFLEEFLRAATVARSRDRFLLVGDATCEVRIQGENIRVVRVPERWTPWWDQVTLSRTLAAGGADVLYSPYIKVPLLAPVPVVSTIHDLTFFLKPQYNGYSEALLLNPPFRLFCKLVVRRAAAILVDSVTSARDVQRVLGPDPAKLRVIPLATSAAFRPKANGRADAAVWSRYGLTPGYILYVGGFWPHKNVPCLARAHATLPGRLRTSHPLVMAGGPVSEDLQRLVKEPGSAVRCVGVVPDPDLPALYRGAALFAFPSGYEGFGLPVLEAMASGVPVLCSTAPALVELTGDAAFHADPEEPAAWERALLLLLEDPDRREMLARRGLARAASFRPERMASEILAVLDEVVARPGSAGRGTPEC
ncbi:MAG: glycosyltransferase family 4 protein [Anaerolineae bacterium]